MANRPPRGGLATDCRELRFSDEKTGKMGRKGGLEGVEGVERGVGGEGEGDEEESGRESERKPDGLIGF